MRNSCGISKRIQSLLRPRIQTNYSSSSHWHRNFPVTAPKILDPCKGCKVARKYSFSRIPASGFGFLRCLNTGASFNEDVVEGTSQDPLDVVDDVNGEVQPIDTWEEEDETEPEAGDGGAGGGVVLQKCPWGEQALSLAREVLQQFGGEMELYAFKTSPRGYIYVRLDKLSNEYGCPSMEEIESFSRQYKKRLEEEIPQDLALEVSSPGADRLLRVPYDLPRFINMPMNVDYVEDLNSNSPEKSGVFFLDSVENESGYCVWKLADVKENRDPSAKGRPLNRKRRDWRLRLPFAAIKRVTLYLD